MKGRSQDDDGVEGLSHEKVAEWVEHAEALESKATCAPELADRNVALLQAAEIWGNLLDEHRRALQAYTRVLEVDPHHEEALARAEQLCEEQGLWEVLTEFFLQLISQTSQPQKRVELYHEVARLQEEGQGERGQAFLTLQVAFREDASDEKTASELERLARRGGLLTDLLSFYTARLNAARDKDTKGILCSRLGLLYTELGHLGAAVTTLNQALEIRPDDGQALSSLVEIHLRQEQWAPLVPLLAKLAKAATETSEKTRALFSLGELHEMQFSNAPKAAASYREVLEIDPLHADAAAGLKRTCGEEEGNWAALVVALEHQLEAQEGIDEQLTILRELAEIELKKLDDVEAAIGALKSIAEMDPDDERSLLTLDGLFERQERWEELVEILELAVDKVSSDRQRLDVLLRLAVVLESHLSSPEEAAGKLEALLAIDASQDVALKRLERIYRDQKRWKDLARTLEYQLDSAEDPDLCLDLSYELGRLRFDRLEDPSAAIKVWESARRLDEADVRVLESLVIAYERIEDHRGEQGALEQLLDIVNVPKDRVEYQYKLAKLFAGALDEPEVATRNIEGALAVDPKHRPSLLLLKELLLDQERWRDAAVTVKRVLDETHDISERSELFNELGSIHDVHLRNLPQAERYFVLALNYNPRNVAAAGNLVELYVEQERFTDALPLFEVLLHTDTVAMLESFQLHRVHFLRGVVEQTQDHDELALESYQKAHELEPEDLLTVRKLAELHRQREEWDQASTWYEMILGLHLDKLSEPEMVEVLYRFGLTAFKRDEHQQALDTLERAFALAPNHRPTIELLTTIHEHNESWQEVVELKRDHLEDLSVEDRVACLVEAADISQEHLKLPLESIECLEEALAIQPGQGELLERLVALYSGQGDWELVVLTLERVIEITESGLSIAKYHREIAEIFIGNLEEPSRAIEHLNRCLDHDPSQLEAFETIDRLLTAEKNWTELATAYSTMLERIKGSDQIVLVANLWHCLGEIYRSRLNEIRAASAAFEMASSLEPDNVDRQVILAELYGRLPDAADKAIEKHRLLLENDPLWVTSYMALSELYRQTRQYDRAWCMCAALCFLGKATSEEIQFYKEYKDQTLRQGGGSMTDALWREILMTSDENRIAGEIFETILPALLRFYTQPHEVYGLNRAQRYDPATGSHPLGELFNWSAFTLGTRPPELFIREGQGVGLSFILTDPLASLADLALLSGLREDETRFEMGRHLATYRGGHFIRCIVPDKDGLRNLFLVAVRTVRPSAEVPQTSSEMGDVEAMLRGSLTPQTMEHLAGLVDTLLKEQASLDIAEWMRAVELTAYRAGLLLCGDIACAPRMLGQHPPEVRGLSLKEAIRQLVVFSISEGYFRLRELVGLSIDPAARLA